MEHREYDMYVRAHVIGTMDKESLSIAEARRRFGVGGSMTIQPCIRRYCPEHVQNKLLGSRMKKIVYPRTVITADSTSADKDRRVNELELELSDQKLLNEYHIVLARIIKEDHGIDIKQLGAEQLKK